MNENHDEVEVAIRTGIQAGDDNGAMGSGVGKDGGHIGSGVGKDGGGTIGSGT